MIGVLGAPQSYLAQLFAREVDLGASPQHI